MAALCISFVVHGCTDARCPHSLAHGVLEPQPSLCLQLGQISYGSMILNHLSRSVCVCAEVPPGERTGSNAGSGDSSSHSLYWSLKQRLQEEALSPAAYRRFLRKFSWWFNRGTGSPEEVYEVFLESYGASDNSELLFFSFAGMHFIKHAVTNVSLVPHTFRTRLPCSDHHSVSYR